MKLVKFEEVIALEDLIGELREAKSFRGIVSSRHPRLHAIFSEHVAHPEVFANVP